MVLLGQCFMLGLIVGMDLKLIELHQKRAGMSTGFWITGTRHQVV